MPTKITANQLKLLENIPSELRTPALWLSYSNKPASKPGKKARKHPAVKWANLPTEKQI